MGDVLALTPSLKAIKHDRPDCRICVYFISDNHLKLLSHNPFIDEFKRIKKRPYWLARHRTLNTIISLVQQRLFHRKRRSIISLSVGSMGTYAVYRKKMAHILADGLDTILLDEQLEIYLTDTELKQGKQRMSVYKKPVIINVMNRSRPQHTWPLSNWNALIEKFPELTFIQVGMTDEPLLKGVVDARDNSENSVRDTVAMLNYADLYVGMDTFWQHAAAAMQTAGVVLHSDGHPAVFGHELHINVFKNRHCAPCMPRLGNSPCPYNVECINSISVDEVATALQQQLNAYHG